MLMKLITLTQSRSHHRRHHGLCTPHEIDIGSMDFQEERVEAFTSDTNKMKTVFLRLFEFKLEKPSIFH